MTAKDETNLRSLATIKSDIVASLKNGETLTRIAVGTNGWSKLRYKNKTVYAITSYLSHDVVEKPKPTEPDQSDGFTAVNEQVTAKSETNLRDKPSIDGGQVIYTLKNGEYVKRIGTHSNGWSKLEYNGQVVYAISSYLVN